MRHKFHILTTLEKCVFLSSDKNACSFFAYFFLVVVGICVAANGACVFCARLRLRIFYFQEDKKMKKLMSLILAIIMLVSFAGCGGEDGEKLPKDAVTLTVDNYSMYFDLWTSCY